MQERSPAPTGGRAAPGADSEAPASAAVPVRHPATPEVVGRNVEVEGLRLHYLECGEGEPVLFLHGWPTSSFLWRRILPRVGARCRAIALDLPGFGRSDKPLGASYSFRFYERAIEGFLDALGVGPIGLAVHDLGGPVGLYWACQHAERVRKLALLNTIVYPDVSWAVALFIASCKAPGVRSLLVSPWGLKATMRLGVHDPRRLGDEALRGVLEPFVTPDARRTLAKAGCGLHPAGMAEIARRLPSLRVPVRVVYGARDRILPDVARTMRRVAHDLPQAEVSVLDDCGHFLQEERPDDVARFLADFFAEAPPS